MMSSVFDPLGFASPFILKARLIIQGLCRLKLAWDDRIPPEFEVAWKEWVDEFSGMSGVKIPRCIQPAGRSHITSQQLHHFSDASEFAYGVASYLRVTLGDGSVESTLVMAKSRLAPLQPMTIPRLELQAATLATKQDELLRRELDLPLARSQFWTDSTTVLRYISCEAKRFQVWVANRITEIRGRTRVEDWHHVPSEDNPADDASRGVSPESLATDRWIHGPEFLLKPAAEWPRSPLLKPVVTEEDPEVRKRAVCMAVQADSPTPVDTLLHRYSDWEKAKRGVAWMLQLKHTALGRGRLPAGLSPEHVREAEISILRYVQRRHLQPEIRALENGRRVSHASKLSRLAPGLKDGLLVSTGRLKHADIPDHTKCPIIVPGAHHVAWLLARHCHIRAGHAGLDFTRAELRWRFWVTGATTVVRAVINDCVICRARAAKPIVQQMADLPADRVAIGGAAFLDVGLDYFGPLPIKRGRVREKRYGCLFTCMTTRAVHLEVAHSLDTSSFISCLLRFMARRGTPSLLRSDNGSNFIGAERELRQIVQELDNDNVRRAMTDRGITWKFNPPLASHMGGVWERQIRSVRRILSGIAREQVLTDEALRTVLTVAEGILNNRPITPVTDDPQGLEALTPNHLLLFRTASALPGNFVGPDLRKQWRQCMYLVDQFWRRWTKEYLPLLRRRTKWDQPHRNVQVGDVVMLLEHPLPRNEWRLGKVAATLPGADGLVRVVRVVTKDSELLRPVSKLCLLEAAAE